MSLSQAQVIGRPKMKSWDDYEQGCLASFGGGYCKEEDRAIFHHGMETVFNLLRSEFPRAEACKASGDLLEACKLLLQTVDVPEANCSCHIAPPCSDCVEHGGLREAIEYAKSAIAKAESESGT